MCNDSAIDFNEFKNAFEKVGEATEAALIVLAEKINPYGVEKRGGRLETAKIVRKVREGSFLFIFKGGVLLFYF
jgi:Ca2+ transporting ATPase